MMLLRHAAMLRVDAAAAASALLPLMLYADAAVSLIRQMFRLCRCDVILRLY